MRGGGVLSPRNKTSLIPRFISTKGNTTSTFFFFFLIACGLLRLPIVNHWNYDLVDNVESERLELEAWNQHRADFGIYVDRGYPSVSWEKLEKYVVVEKNGEDDNDGGTVGKGDGKVGEGELLCHFNKEEEGPVPIIFMSLGRSGSFVTWQVMARMTRSTRLGGDGDSDGEVGDNQDNEPDPQKAVEITGRTQPESLDFFNTIPPSIGSRWAELVLCGLQTDPARFYTSPTTNTSTNSTTSHTTTRRRTRQSKHQQKTQHQQHVIQEGITGFQWKPYDVTNSHTYALGALRSLSKVRNPRPRIVYLTRNPIDRKISNLRYLQTKEQQQQNNHNHTDVVMPPHCKVGDTACLTQHQESLRQNHGVVFPTNHALINWLKTDMDHTRSVLDHLATSGIRHVHVQYEKLFPSPSKIDIHRKKAAGEEWTKLLLLVGERGMGKGLANLPGGGVTWEQVEKHIRIASTTDDRLTKKDKIRNFEEVKNSLKGTGFLHLLAN